MEKEEILAKAQKENNGVDLADKSAQKDGAWIAYIAFVGLVIVVDIVNGFVLHNLNRGMDFVLFTAAFIVFLVKFIRLRKKHEIIPLVIWGVLSISMLVVWILQLCRVF